MHKFNAHAAAIVSAQWGSSWLGGWAGGGVADAVTAYMARVPAPLFVLSTASTILAPPVSNGDDEAWSVAADIVNDYIRHPNRDDVVAVDLSFRHALRLLLVLHRHDIDCPVPFIDADGDALLLWKKENSVLAMTITPNAISLMVHKDGELVFASGEIPMQAGIPVELWKQLQIVSREAQTQILKNSTHPSSYLASKLSRDLSPGRLCFNFPETKPYTLIASPFFISLKNPVAGNQWSGKNTVPPLMLTG